MVHAAQSQRGTWTWVFVAASVLCALDGFLAAMFLGTKHLVPGIATFALAVVAVVLLAHALLEWVD